MATRECKICGRMCNGEYCTECLLEQLITYAESKEYLIDRLKYAVSESERAIFDELHPELFMTNTR